jgi:hypothetical protein
MLTKSRLIALLGLLALVASVLVAGALAASGGGTADLVKFKTGGRVDTPSGTFLDVPNASVTVSPAVGAQPLLIRFSASGYEQDYNMGGSFVGKKYAAMLVRVLVDGTQVGPVVRFFDNTGKVGVKTPRPTNASYEWATTVTGGGGPKQIKVQFRNLHTWDSATIVASTLAVQYH